MTDARMPAWSEPFAPEAREQLARGGRHAQIDRTGRGATRPVPGVKVAIIDSGVEGTHPVVGGRLVEIGHGRDRR